MSDTQNPASSRWSRARPALRSWLWTGGVEGNAQLTALTGLLLLVLLFIEGITILRIRTLFNAHAFVGLLLVPPVLLKMTSTGYRFIRYYSGNRSYRAAGPPRPIPRMIAPVLVASTIGLFGTGIALLITGPTGSELWRRLHSLFFFIWFWVMAVHVLTYFGRAPRLVLADLRPQGGRAVNNLAVGSITRQGLLVGSLLLGLAIAVAAIPWDESWIHWLARLGPAR